MPNDIVSVVIVDNGDTEPEVWIFASGEKASVFASARSSTAEVKSMPIIDDAEADRLIAAERLEYLRGELRAERISWGELHELQGLAEHIEPGDVELLEAAGVPEFPDESDDDS